MQRQTRTRPEKGIIFLNRDEKERNIEVDAARAENEVSLECGKKLDKKIIIIVQQNGVRKRCTGKRAGTKTDQENKGVTAILSRQRI